MMNVTVDEVKDMQKAVDKIHETSEAEFIFLLANRKIKELFKGFPPIEFAYLEYEVRKLIETAPNHLLAVAFGERYKALIDKAIEANRIRLEKEK